ncbi:MAG: DUF6029 family protein [Bacteroidales bacterium]|jgi:hypothetical protein|nr:DUF6029 family protein [Bacteroidales bacterium]
MKLNTIFSFFIVFILLFFLFPVKIDAQSGVNLGKISGDFGFNGMYYLEDSLIGARKVDSKVRANTFLNLNYTNGGFSAGVRYEFYLFPLIDMEDIGYKGQGFTRYFADYQNKFIQVTGGTFYEQFGNGLTLRAYEERDLGVDNSLLGGRVKVTPYKGITVKGVWGIERKNFDFKYSERNDQVRGIDGEINFSEIFPILTEKQIALGIGGSLVSKYEKSIEDFYFNRFVGTDSSENISISAGKIPQNVAVYGVRGFFGIQDFRFEGEYARKVNDPNVSNNFIYKHGEAVFLSATYAMKGLGISASLIASDNMDFRSSRYENNNSLLGINYIPAINRTYSYQLIGNYAYASQANSEIGGQLQINYQIPKKSKLGGKYGTDITFNYARFHSLAKDTVLLAIENGTMTGTEGYTSNLFKGSKELLYQDVGLEISHRFNKTWKLMVAYNFLSVNLDVLRGHGGIFYGHNVATELLYKINSIHALRLELHHLYSKNDFGSWAYGMLEYSINPNWFISVGDQWNYGNIDKEQRIHYYNAMVAFVTGTTRIALSFGKTREGILCVGGVCRTVPASFGLGLSVSTAF